MDAFDRIKDGQKKIWATFAPLETQTCAAAAPLVRFADVRAGQRVLDVAGGTGVVAIAAARRGAKVTGSDLTPELLERARENATIASAPIDFVEADVEKLPFEDGSFDVVLSQFGHMFAPRPEVAVAEMLRVLAPGGTIAFSTWPPELYTGRMFAVVARHLPAPPVPVPPPSLWGDPNVVRERLGDRVADLVFDRGVMRAPYLSVPHVRAIMEHGIGPMQVAVRLLADKPDELARMRRDIDALASEYFEPDANVLRQDYLMTRARKK